MSIKLGDTLQHKRYRDGAVVEEYETKVTLVAGGEPEPTPTPPEDGYVKVRMLWDGTPGYDGIRNEGLTSIIEVRPGVFVAEGVWTDTRNPVVEWNRGGAHEDPQLDQYHGIQFDVRRMTYDSAVLGVRCSSWDKAENGDKTAWLVVDDITPFAEFREDGKWLRVTIPFKDMDMGEGVPPVSIDHLAFRATPRPNALRIRVNNVWLVKEA